MNRGTLTLLADGKVIFGLPEGCDINEKDIETVRSELATFMHSGIPMPIIFAFPIDVVDLRVHKVAEEKPNV
jgi:hypothetical protein